VYLEVLKNLRYENSKDRPSVGQRVVYVVLFDGEGMSDPFAHWQWRLFLPLTPYTQLPPIASLGEDQDTFRGYGLQQDVVTYRGLQSHAHYGVYMTPQHS